VVAVIVAEEEEVIEVMEVLQAGGQASYPPHGGGLAAGLIG
jgi:hypothetical protein